MGVYVGFHFANVDPDRLYVTLVILLAAAWWLNNAYQTILLLTYLKKQRMLLELLHWQF